MMEPPFLPSIVENKLPPLSNNSSVRTISSTIPNEYERRVRFSDPSMTANSSDSIVSEPCIGNHHGMNDGPETYHRFGHGRSRPLSQIEPLSASSLSLPSNSTNSTLSRSGAQGSSSETLSMQPRIEIRLRRPTSLYDVTGEATTQSLDRIRQQDTSSPKTASPSSRRLNKWRFPKKLSRIASSPSLFNYAEHNKARAGMAGSLPSPVDPGSPSNNSDDSPEARKAPTDFLSRFKKKKSKLPPGRRRGGSSLLIEVFNKGVLEEAKNEEESKAKDAAVEGGMETEEQKELDTTGSTSSLPSRPSTLRSSINRDSRDLDSSDASSFDDRLGGNQSMQAAALVVPRSSSFSRSRAKVHLLRHFTSQIPSQSEDFKPLSFIKDATSVHPFNDGEVLVTDILSNKMVLFDANGMPKVSFTLDQASEPWGSCLTSDGSLAVTLRQQGCVSLWSLTGVSLSEFGHEILVAPTGIQIDALDRFVVADETLNRVFVFTKNGHFLLTFIHPQTNRLPDVSSPSATMSEHFHFDKPRYVCVTVDGHYVIADSANHCVRIFDSHGNFCSRIGSFGKRDGDFRFPYGVACDNYNSIYVADHFNHRVSVFNLKGDFLCHVLTPQDGITRPKGLAIRNTNLYVTYGNLRAWKISVFNLVNRQIICNH